MHLKKYNQKVPAFTIVELMVGLAMTSILLLIGFYGYQLIQFQYRLYQQTADEITSYQNLAYRLNMDAQNAQYMHLEDGYLAFQQKEQKIIYALEETFVLRYQTSIFSKADTFWAVAELKTSAYQQTLVNQGLIDHAEIQLFAFDEPQTIHLKKNYSAFDLMKNPTK